MSKHSFLTVTKNDDKIFTEEEVASLEQLLGGTAWISSPSHKKLIFSPCTILEMKGEEACRAVVYLNFENLSVQLTEI